MIHYKSGNILDVTSGVIIHGCNAQGVMGSGVALAIREKYPACYDAYLYSVVTTPLKLGETIWYRKDDSFWIANAITQQTYGRQKNKRYVNYSAISLCFSQVIDMCCAESLDLHFPKIGAGLGGGDWNIIEQLINDCDPEDAVTKICWVL